MNILESGARYSACHSRLLFVTFIPCSNLAARGGLLSAAWDQDLGNERHEGQGIYAFRFYKSYSEMH
jgi:hypothetical protein